MAMKFSTTNKICNAFLLVLITLNFSISASWPSNCTPACENGDMLNLIPPALIVPYDVTLYVKFWCMFSCENNPDDGREPVFHWTTIINNTQTNPIQSEEALPFLANESIQLISCYHQNLGLNSNNSTLQVLSEPPAVDPNPFLQVSRSTLNLTWSPPYLWPGHYIDIFNISIEIRSDGVVNYTKTVSFNSTHDALESFDINSTVIGDQLPIVGHGCTELTMEIMAYDRYCGWLPKIVNVSKMINPERDALNQSMVSIDSEVFFSFTFPGSDIVSDIIVKIYIHFEICQDLNYTIVVTNTDTGNTSFMESFRHASSEPNLATHEIMSPDFEIDMSQYMVELEVLVDSPSDDNSTIIKLEHEFDINFPCGAASMRTLSLWTILTLSILILFIL